MSNVVAVIAGHGDFARGMISAVATIAGRDDRFVGLSNSDLTPEVLEARLRTLVEEHRPRVIFTDLPSGSPTAAARRVLADHPEVVLITGASLAMLLTVACAPDGAAVDLSEGTVERARQGMRLVAGRPRGD